MNNRIGQKKEVYKLEELMAPPNGFKYFACIGGSKNFECFFESTSLSRAAFMEKYKNKLDNCHFPIYEDDDIIIRQDAQIALPGFYIIATKKEYKSISGMELEIYQKSLFYVGLIRRELKNSCKIDRAYMYYDEHLDKPSSTHFWVMPIYNEVVRKNNLNVTILNNDIWKYQELFYYSETKEKIYEMNETMRKKLKKGE